MAKVPNIYHPQSGNTGKIAKAVSGGVVAPGVTMSLKKVFDAAADDLLNCDGVVFSTRNYFGYEAGAVEDFFDHTFYTLSEKVSRKFYGTFNSYGGGSSKAIKSLNKLCNNLDLKKTAESVGTLIEPSSEALEKCRALGERRWLYHKPARLVW